MSEDDYFALGETADRVELFDGSLHVTVNPGVRHQHVSGLLGRALDEPARAAGLEVLPAVNVRLQPGRVVIPDLVITTCSDLDEIAINGCEIRFVSEILSPGNHAVDEVLKMHYYAAAKIPWYLIADPVARTLCLHKLVGDDYVGCSVTHGGDVLRLVEPVTADLDVAALLPD